MKRTPIIAALTVLALLLFAPGAWPGMAAGAPGPAPGEQAGVAAAGGLATTRAAPANLLGDPGFEESALDGTFPSSGYWQPAWLGTAGAVCPALTAARSGSVGLWEYTGSPTTDWYSGTYQDVPAAPGEVFACSAWARSQSSWVEGSRAFLRVAFLTSAGTTISSGQDSPAISTADSGWQQLSVQTGAAPAGTAHLRFSLRLEKPNGASGQSIANFDDCLVEKSAATAPALSVSPVTLAFGDDLTTLSFAITNSGGGELSWSLAKDAAWLSVSSASGTAAGETDTVTVTVSRGGLSLPTYHAAISVTSNGGDKNVDVLMEKAPAGAVPAAPAEVTTSGYRLMVQRRLPNGRLDIARPYTIKGAGWSPASVGTPADVTARRSEFGAWYRADVQFLKEMNGNTFYLFLDPGTSAEQIAKARAVLDYCYRNGIMVIMTVDEGVDDVATTPAKITAAVNAFKNHPAVLMWALGNEWNLWRPDRRFYYGSHPTLEGAANAMQANALLVKSLDAHHPVASILGEINYPTAADVSRIVNTTCTAVDVWGANIYRGAEFYELFNEWKAVSAKPLYISELGTDAFRSTSWWPVLGAEDEAAQATRVGSLWADLAQELSAVDPSKVCLGGAVFEWNDEWWKTGSPSVHDPDGYETTWNPTAHPDGFANEEWFGIVSIDRERREVYYTLQSAFAGPVDATPMIARLSPTSAKRGATVTITGSGFGATQGAGSVRFGSKTCASYVSWSDAQITCKVPAKAAYGSLKVTVTTAAGASNGEGFRVKR